MNISPRYMKLRYQLALLIGIALLMMTLIQLFYYFWFSVLTENRARMFMTDIQSQVEDKLISNAKDIKKAAWAICYSSVVQESLSTDSYKKRLDLSVYILDMINNFKAANDSIEDMIIIDSNGVLLNPVSTNASWVREYYLEKYKSQMEDTEQPYVTFFTEDYYAYIYSFYRLPGYNAAVKNDGVCIILCKTGYIDNIIGKLSMMQNSLFLVLDRDNRVVAANPRDKLKAESIAKEWINPASERYNSEQYYRNEKTLIQYQMVKETEWKIVSFVPVKELKADMRPIRNTGLMIGIIAFILILLIGIILSRDITRPISKMIRFLGLIGEKNMQQRLEMTETNEIGQLARHINSMLDKIEDMTRKIFTSQSSLYEMEIAKKQAQLSALQSQINPHFLYNTLECLRSIGLEKGIREIVKISSAMADIFRYSIKGEDFVSVQEEVECIRNYIDIMMVRYAGKFTAEINIPASIMPMKITKMILQPIVENAIYHGLEMKLEEGSLRVEGYIREENTLCFEIRDDGEGMEPEELENLQKRLSEEITSESLLKSRRRSLGLLNINDRIRLAYGMQYGLSIESNHMGTKVLVCLPAIKE